MLATRVGDASTNVTRRRPRPTGSTGSAAVGRGAPRRSSADARRLDSAVRPYLGTGLVLRHFSSDSARLISAQGLEAPAGEIASTSIGLRSHVGIDIRLSRHLNFRYSFSETISSNPISPSLTPPAPRRLANFQNLFGLVGRF